MRILSLLCFALFSILPSAHAQVKATANVNQVWIAYFNQSRFSKHFGTWTDLHLRTKEDFLTNFSQSMIRLGLTYYAGENTRFTAGYAFVNHFPADNHAKISRPEHRPWQQVQWTTRSAKTRTSQFLRLEERYRRKIANEAALAEGYQFNYRLRYNFLISAPLSKNAFQPKSLAFVFNDEVHVNFGKEVVYNYFDQNRFFLGLAYQVNTTDNLQFGYLNVFQQLPAGNRYRFIHALRLSYFQNFDFRSK